MKVQNPFRVAFVATLGVGLGLLLITSIQTLSTILLYVGTALFLSLGLDPIISWLEKRRLPRWAAVTITILAVLLAFAGIVLMILPILVTQVGQLITAVTDLVGRKGFWTDVENWVTSTFPNLQLDVVLQQVQKWALDNAGTITTGVLGVGIAVLRGTHRCVHRADPDDLLHRRHARAEEVGVPARAGLQAAALHRPRRADHRLGRLLRHRAGEPRRHQRRPERHLPHDHRHAPFPAVLAVIAFFFSLIPLVGTLTGSTHHRARLLDPGWLTDDRAHRGGIYYLIYMQVEAYVHHPRIMNRAVSVPGAVVVIAALAGGSLLGLLGALIAIPVAASILIIYRQVVDPAPERALTRDLSSVLAAGRPTRSAAAGRPD